MCEKESEGECQPCHTLVQHKLFIFFIGTLLHELFVSYFYFYFF